MTEPTTDLAERTPDLASLREVIVDCRLCPRLVEHREEVARHPPRRFVGQRYWARPVPGWGASTARIVIVGLAPAAHGGNRTGRIFTGDRSGDFLFAALHRAGLASQPTSVAADDGTTLRGVYIAAVNRCAPPGNQPTPRERDNCVPYLVRELELLRDAGVIVALGGFAWYGALRALARLGERPRPKPRFAHGSAVTLGNWVLLGCLHPSQQNTFTGRLTPVMLDGVLARARGLAGDANG